MDRIGKKLGNYEIQRLIGRGGFAEVYLGQHVFLQRPAAIKVMEAQFDAPAFEQFRAEAQVIARLQHPNIVPVLEFGLSEEDHAPFLVMEYSPQGSLRQRFPRGTRVGLQESLAYLKQVAAALQYAHNNRIIHRDIKPENMLLGNNGQLLLSDFGIALVLQSSHYQNSKDIVGTIAYMAPEQLQGRVVFASDQYALGITLYEWLTGTLPFQGSFAEVGSQHLHTPTPSLLGRVPGLPAGVDQVLTKALMKDPGQRFASVQDFAQAFEMAARGEDPTVLIRGSFAANTVMAPPEINARPAALAETSPDSTLIKPAALVDNSPDQATVAEPSTATPTPANPLPPIAVTPGVYPPAPQQFTPPGAFPPVAPTITAPQPGIPQGVYPPAQQQQITPAGAFPPMAQQQMGAFPPAQQQITPSASYPPMQQQQMGATGAYLPIPQQQITPSAPYPPMQQQQMGATGAYPPMPQQQITPSAPYPPMQQQMNATGAYSPMQQQTAGQFGQPIQQLQPQKKSNGVLILVAILLLVVLLGGGGTLGYLHFFANTTASTGNLTGNGSLTATTQTVATPTTAPTPTPTADLTATVAATTATPGASGTAPASGSATPGSSPATVGPGGSITSYSAPQPGPGCDQNGGNWTPGPQGAISSIACGTTITIAADQTRGYLALQLPGNSAFASTNRIAVTGAVGYNGWNNVQECVGLAELDTGTGYLVEYCNNGQWSIYTISSTGTVVKTLDTNITSQRQQENISLALKGSTLTFTIDTEVHTINVTPIQPTKVAITAYCASSGDSFSVNNFSYITQF